MKHFLASLFLYCSFHAVGLSSVAFSQVSAPVEQLSFDDETVKTKDRTVDNILFEDDYFRISPVYPNPTEHVARFTYSLSKGYKARMVLRNALGSVEKIVVLNPNLTEVNLNLFNYKPGLYFYSIQYQGSTVASRTLIVKS